ncbi:hypothetical protein Tco_0941385 [Tanacetum coccineum]|uniref:Gag-pol polyprotein n=1 Tax=Tanacetum coccineum TaxID=301880 RepID=A0ABQ5DQQ4_9ASTR
MTSLADKSLLSGGDNKPPMLEKHLYDSWKSRMELYMMNRPHGRMILASVEKGPLVWPSITEDGVTRLKEYVELTPAEAIQADCDIKAINIILQGLPTEIYALVSQHRVAKDLWEKIKLLMQGTSLTKQERECKLYDEFDKFTYKKGETLHEYYLRFTLLLNDMNIYKMPLEQFQVNTKFLNTLPDEWSKFVTDVKLVKDLHTTNVDQLHAHANYSLVSSSTTATYGVMADYILKIGQLREYAFCQIQRRLTLAQQIQRLVAIRIGVNSLERIVTAEKGVYIRPNAWEYTHMQFTIDTDGGFDLDTEWIGFDTVGGWAVVDLRTDWECIDFVGVRFSTLMRRRVLWGTLRVGHDNIALMANITLHYKEIWIALVEDALTEVHNAQLLEPANEIQLNNSDPVSVEESERVDHS